MKPEREALINNFLSESFWKDARKTNIASDASRRSYFRLTLGKGRTSIFMDAPPEFGEDVTKFLKVRDSTFSLNFRIKKIILVKFYFINFFHWFFINSNNLPVFNDFRCNLRPTSGA